MVDREWTGIYIDQRKNWPSGQLFLKHGLYTLKEKGAVIMVFFLLFYW